MRLKRFSVVLLLAGSSLLCRSGEGSTKDGFRFPISASWGIGSLEDTKTTFPSRTMGAFSFDVFPNYHWNDWSFGIYGDLRLLQQFTDLATTGNTNWRGTAYLFGIGVGHEFDDFYVQGGVDFLGAYDHKQASSKNEATGFRGPLGFRLKVGYHFCDSLPGLSVHLGANYITFGKFALGATERDSSAKLLMGMVGLTYEFSDFGGGPGEAPTKVAEEKPAPPPPPVEPAAPSAQEQELAKIIDTKRTDQGLMLNLKGDVSFAPGSSKLSPKAEETIRMAAEILKKDPNSKIRIEGHTDSTGNKDKNLALSKARAENVKATLVRHGLSADNVSFDGLGDSRPVQPNDTKAGKAANRRVEIYIDQNAH